MHRGQDRWNRGNFVISIVFLATVGHKPLSTMIHLNKNKNRYISSSSKLHHSQEGVGRLDFNALQENKFQRIFLNVKLFI